MVLRNKLPRNPSKWLVKFVVATVFVLSIVMAILLLNTEPSTSTSPTTTSGYLNTKFINNLSEPFNRPKKFNELTKTSIWQEVMAYLWVNRDKQAPSFASADSQEWNQVASVIPANVVGIQVSKDRSYALIYRSGIPDYKINTPEYFPEYKPGNIYGILKLSAVSTSDTNKVHEFPSKGSIGVFDNGSSIFNYTDTFSFENENAWSYNANVAEALIVNSDIAHATPSNNPLFPESRGIFHNHQSSRQFLEQLSDPFTKGQLSHSVNVGFAIDNNPIYGPIGYTTQDGSDHLKILQSSYLTPKYGTKSLKSREKRGFIGSRSNIRNPHEPI